VKVKKIREDAGAGMPRLERHESGFAQAVEIFGMPPQFQLRDHAHLIAEFKQRAVTVGGFAQIEAGFLGGARWGRGDSPAANLCDGIHVHAGLLHALRAQSVVVHDELGKSDGALHDEAEVGDAFAEIFQRSAFRGVPVHLVEPGLDRAVARLRGELDLFGKAHLESA